MNYLDKLAYLLNVQGVFKIDLSLGSEWVIGNQEDLAKRIVAEIQPENGEVIS